jgi:hypothetical protein
MARSLGCIMTAMSFRPDFWVAIATAAPLITLSTTVLAADNMKLAARALTGFRSSRLWRHIRKSGLKASMIVGVNIGVQTFIMYCALKALANDSNVISPTLAIAGEVCGLISVLIITAQHGLMMLTMTKYRERETSGAPESAVDLSEEEAYD